MNKCPSCGAETHDGMTTMQPAEGSAFEKWTGCPRCWDEAMVAHPLMPLLFDMFQTTQVLFSDVERERDAAYDVAYRSIMAAADKAGAVEGDPRWYGINIALRAIMELRDG